MHPLLVKFLSRFLTKKQLRYIDRNQSEVKNRAESLMWTLFFILAAILVGFVAYGAHFFTVIINLSLTLGLFWLIFHSIFNSEDAKNRPEAYDHVAGMGFALTYGVAFIVIFLIVLALSISYVHGVVYPK